ncbi:hypothetical protein [Pseudomonas aeruginosa]|uniref:hypothetical protein n=1 Tax=Pseudomonas aeruginosa TaxID=287 RepID=UPI001A21F36B|nr:hypothetical protein [Pseudomonas aeruginosa]MDI3829418.1 hypothetical protein [Pseudomonas aeruginosa]HBN9565044.1 hypothetical protein [Pseudomonas aeruginosa]HBO3132174.1 hypothetical protein [Pseudomonas aeruginosa]HEH9254327.1 hypothetical protein [Pseudomonas aeruginosa]
MSAGAVIRHPWNGVEVEAWFPADEDARILVDLVRRSYSKLDAGQVEMLERWLAERWV